MTEWYYAKNNQQLGPVSLQEIRNLASTGALQPTDLVWKEGMADWIEAGAATELFPQGLPYPASGKARRVAFPLPVPDNDETNLPAASRNPPCAYGSPPSLSVR